MTYPRRRAVVGKKSAGNCNNDMITVFENQQSPTNKSTTRRYIYIVLNACGKLVEKFMQECNAKIDFGQYQRDNKLNTDKVNEGIVVTP